MQIKAGNIQIQLFSVIGKLSNNDNFQIPVCFSVLSDLILQCAVT